MKLIQLILIIGLLVILVSYFRWFRSAVIDKLLIAAILAAGIVLVVFPDLTTRLAAALGVGRGADLIFYLFMVAVCYFRVLSAHMQIDTVPGGASMKVALPHHLLSPGQALFAPLYPAAPSCCVG